MIRRAATAWILPAGLLLAAAGCEAPHDSIAGIINRQSHALARLPAEERARLVTPAGTVVVEPDPVLEPGLLDLERARQVALRSNPDIEAARARLEAALARIDEARSFYFPQFEMLHNSTRTFQTPNRLSYSLPFLYGFSIPTIPANPTLVDLLSTVTDIGGRYFFSRNRISTGNTNSFSDHATGLSAGWTIFDGFVREARLLSAKHGYLASAMGLADAERLLVQAVDRAYYQWQLGRERLRIAEADEAFSRQQLEDAQKQFAAQRITRAGVLNFEVRMRAAQADVVAAEGLQETAEVVLAELLALAELRIPEDVQLAPLADETPAELTPPDEAEWIAASLDGRPDLAALRHLANAREENILIAKGQFSPVVSLRGSWGYEHGSTMKYSDEDQSSAIGLEMRWAISTGGFRTSQVRRARADWWEAAAALKRKRLEVVSQVRRAVVDVRKAQREVQLQRQNLEAARENRQIVQAEYASGKASLVRLNEAQRDFVETDGGLTRARIQLRLAWSDLRAAAGAYRVGLDDAAESPPVAPDTE